MASSKGRVGHGCFLLVAAGGRGAWPLVCAFACVCMVYVSQPTFRCIQPLHARHSRQSPPSSLPGGPARGPYRTQQQPALPASLEPSPSTRPQAALRAANPERGGRETSTHAAPPRPPHPQNAAPTPPQTSASALGDSAAPARYNGSSLRSPLTCCSSCIQLKLKQQYVEFLLQKRGPRPRQTRPVDSDQRHRAQAHPSSIQFGPSVDRLLPRGLTRSEPVVVCCFYAALHHPDACIDRLIWADGPAQASIIT